RALPQRAAEARLPVGRTVHARCRILHFPCELAVCRASSVRAARSPDTGPYVTLQLFFTVFATVFIAELGDKTQLATLLFAGRSPGNLWSVFLGASAALVLSTAIGVAAGAALAHFINPKYLTYAAGIGFIAVGFWTLWSAQAG